MAATEQTADLDFNNDALIVNLPDPTNPQDAATKAYVDLVSSSATSCCANEGDPFTSGDPGSPAYGMATAITPSLTEGNWTQLRTDLYGNLRVNITNSDSGDVLPVSVESTKYWGVASSGAGVDATTAVSAVRKDAGGAFTGVVDGDWTPLQTDAAGALWVHDVGGGGGGVSADSGTAFVAADPGTPAIGVRNDAISTPTGVADGDYVMLQTDQFGNLRVNLTGYDFTGVMNTQDIGDVYGGTTAYVGGFSQPLGTSTAVREDTATDLAGSAGNFAPLQVDADGALWVHDVGGGGGVSANSGAAFVAGDPGTPAYAVRHDSFSALSGVADGDYSPLLTDNNGLLKVAIYDSDNTGGSPMAVYDIYGKGANTAYNVFDAGTPISAVRKDTATDLSIGGDGFYGPLQMDANGALRVVDESTTGGGVSVNEGDAFVAADAGTPAYAVVSASGFPTVTDGAWTPLFTDDTGRLRVNIAAADSYVSVLTGFEQNPGAVYAGGNPVAVTGAVRQDAAGALSGVADGDVTPLIVDSNGYLKVNASGAAVPITDNSGSLTVDQPTGSNLHTVVDSGTITTVSTITNVVHIDDNAAAISVDWNGTTPVTGSGTATGALRVELPTNGTGTVGLNAGTNAIGKLAANSGIDIGDVDVTSIVPGVAATNLGKAEDAAHTTGDTGVMALAVRSNVAVATGTTDGDYTALITDTDGALWVHNVTASGGVSAASGAAFIGADPGTPAYAVRRDTPTAFAGVVDNDYTPLTTDANGKLWVNAEISPGTGATSLGKAEDAAHTTGDVGVMMLGVRNDTPSALATTNGDYIPLTTNSTGSLYVSISGNAAGDLGKAEDASHTTGDTGVMSLAVRTDTPSALATTTGDYIPLITDELGNLRTIGKVTSGTTSITALNQAVTIDTKGVASVSVDYRGSGTSTIIFEATIDDSTWFTVYGQRIDTLATVSTLDRSFTTGAEIPVYGWSQFRARCSAFTSSTGTLVVRGNGVGQPGHVRSMGLGSNTLPTAQSANGIPVMPWLDRSGTAIIGGRATSSQPSTITDATGAPLTMTQRGALWIQPTIGLVNSQVTPTIQAAAYVAGDQLHSSTNLSFASVTPASGRPVQIVGAWLIDKAIQNIWTELWIFASSATLVNPNANDAFSITDANLASTPPICIIDFLAADYKNTAANSFCQGSIFGGPVNVMAIPSSTAFSGVLVTRGAPTYASTSDIVVNLVVNPL